VRRRDGKGKVRVMDRLDDVAASVHPLVLVPLAQSDSGTRDSDPRRS
jgi:hypothetical protein